MNAFSLPSLPFSAAGGRLPDRRMMAGLCSLLLHLLPLLFILQWTVRRPEPPRILTSVWVAPAAPQAVPSRPVEALPSPAVHREISRKMEPAARAAVPAASAVSSSPQSLPAESSVAHESSDKLPVTPSPASERRRGEGEYQPPSFQAAYLNNPQPPYPLLSRKQRESGEVRLRVLVATSGQPEQVQIHLGSGYPRLDLAARNAVLTWRFQPAIQAGQALAAWVEVPIQFKLEN